MGPFEMVIAIVAIGAIAGIINNRQKLSADRRVSQSADVATSHDVARMQADIDRLQERVRVLERITTDPEHQLSQQFRNLA